jgi:uroporphyrinogen decarboxylase
LGKALLNVLQGRMPSRRPVWLMRQAGRYLPEYRQLRASAGSFLNLCYHAEMAAEVTLQPLRRYDFDAAIVFSDILVVPHGMGADLSFAESEGPILSRVTSMADVTALGTGEGSSQFASVRETLSRVKGELLPHQSLIGFCGAPWTVASYMVEGRGSNRELALHHAREGTPWFQALVDRLVTSSITYLAGQIRSGAEVVQIFDSWAGDLPIDIRKRWVVEPIAKIMKGLAVLGLDVPVIVFARGLGEGQVSIAAEHWDRTGY